MANRTKITLSVIVLVYFIFTSGFIFEVTKSNSTNKIEIPYNPALSAERTGVVGIFTNCDIECAEWIAKNTQDTDKIAGDVNSSILLMSYIKQDRVRKDYVTKVYDYETLPDSCYIMILDWNAKHNMGVRVTGVGTRMTFPMPVLNYLEVFSCGNSRILKKG